MEKDWLTRVVKIVVTVGMIFLVSMTLYNSCNKPIDTVAIQAMQSKIDSIYMRSQITKERLIDTLIIEKNNEKETIKRLQEINNYYSSSETNIDTIPIILSDVRSPFAKRKLQEWVLREDTGYYNIPK